MGDGTGAQATFAGDQAARALGIKALVLSSGATVLEMTVTESMVNGHGMAHGGLVFLLADTAFACACNYPGAVTVAASADITFVSQGRVGEVLTARAVERRRYGRSGIYDVTVTREEGNVIAEFRGHSRTIEGELVAGVKAAAAKA